MHRTALVLLSFALATAACSTAAGEAASDSASSPGALVTAGDPAAQMAAILATARAAAAGERPGGNCYAAVARYIDTVGYGAMKAQPGSQIGSLPAIPDGYGAYAHDFADYANEPGHAAALGLTRLALDSPYDAPAGAIVVVRAGTPGTHHPTAGDIAIAAGGGVFYNDGEMSYGGAGGFPAGNDFVLGIYVPRSQGTACTTDAACSGGRAHTGRVCSNERACIVGCHVDEDCPAGGTCEHTAPHWSCR